MNSSSMSQMSVRVIAMINRISNTNPVFNDAQSSSFEYHKILHTLPVDFDDDSPHGFGSHRSHSALNNVSNFWMRHTPRPHPMTVVTVVLRFADSHSLPVCIPRRRRSSEDASSSVNYSSVPRICEINDIFGGGIQSGNLNNRVKLPLSGAAAPVI